MPRPLAAALAAAGAALAVSALPATAGAASFKSPDSNIHCVLAKAGVRCDIKERTWEPPPPPATCELDYGQGLVLGKTGRGAYVCAGDTVIGTGNRRLGYGKSIERGRFRCQSKRSGMKCVNQRNGHGFKLSAAKKPARF